jgi:hypothetical protein
MPMLWEKKVALLHINALRIQTSNEASGAEKNGDGHIWMHTKVNE